MDKKEPLEKIEITVMKDTANGLRKIAKDAGTTVGEIVDRLVLQMTPTDPDVAEFLFVQEMLIIMSRLSKEDAHRVNTNFAESILMSCSSETLDELVSEIKQKKADIIEQFTAMPEEKRAEVRDALRECMENGLGEKIISP